MSAPPYAELLSSLRQIEAERQSEPEAKLAARFVDSLSTDAVRALAIRCAIDAVWDLRRRRQKAIEDHATRVRRPRRKQATAQTDQAVEASKVAELANEMRAFYDNPETFPVEAEQSVATRIPFYEWYRENEWDLIHGDQPTWHESTMVGLGLDSFPGLHRQLDDFDAWVVTRAERTGQDARELLSLWGRHDTATSLSLKRLLDREREAIRLEITDELLASEFAVGDGQRVTWAAASIVQHQARIDLLVGNASGNMQTAAKHAAAVDLLVANSADCLGDLATEAAA